MEQLLEKQLINLNRREYSLRSESEIRKQLKALEEEIAIGEPFTERKNIARIAAKQSLRWVLGEADSPLTY